MNRSLALCVSMLVAALASGCNASAPAGTMSPIAPLATGAGTATRPSDKPDAIRTPALLVVTPNGILKYYPIKANGGRQPIEVAKIPHVQLAASMAAHGRTLAIADQGKQSVVLYDLNTQATQVLPDPYGVPVDVAVGRNGDAYLLNQVGSLSSTVVRYPAHSRRPALLACDALVRGAAIALDDEGDVFVNGYDLRSPGVFEFPTGPNGPQSGQCTRLALQPESGYAAGIAVDPKTGDLVVVSDPGSCSGGLEGLMTIYPRPYAKRTARSAYLNGRCIGFVRLNAASNLIFALDRTSSFAHAYVIQRAYPLGSGDASYRHKYVGGFVTLPNALPN